MLTLTKDKILAFSSIRFSIFLCEIKSTFKNLNTLKYAELQIFKKNVICKKIKKGLLR